MRYSDPTYVDSTGTHETPAPSIRELSLVEAPLWDRFVEACPEASFFHKAGWREVIEHSFGHDTYYLYAEQVGEIVGIFPLVHIRSRLFGNSLISNAFCVTGGPVARNDADRTALLAEARRLADRLDVDYLECRCPLPADKDWQIRSGLYAGFRRPIDPELEKNLMMIPRKQRAMVRKAEKRGLVSKIDGEIERFFRIYATSVRNLGTPVFGIAYFRGLKQTFGDACEITTIFDAKGQAVSSVMSFIFRDEILPYYGGGTAEARMLAANDLMYWEVMRRACERGFQWFDFGRSKIGTGAYDFKKNWGFEPTPITYSYWLRRLDHLPDINPLNPKYRRLIAVWKRLPLPLANLLGPRIARYLG